MFSLKMKNIILFTGIFFILFLLTFNTSLARATPAVINFTTNGSWVIPAGVTEIMVEAWGAGGGGGGGGASNKYGGGGGAGGQYTTKNFTVNAGENYSIEIGIGGISGGKDINGTSGGDTRFNSTLVVAKGGEFGQCYISGGGGGIGSIDGVIGTIFYPGGNGSNGNRAGSGAGGGGAGSTAAGGNASGLIGGTGGYELGGDGGAGTAGASASGGPGLDYGGASGGSTKNGNGGISGGNGFLRITYTQTDPCTCAGLNNNWEINMGDACNIVEDCDLGTGNVTFIGTGNVIFNATISCVNLEKPAKDQTIFLGSIASIIIG
ncbi:MAG: hypothetical protein ABIF88_00095 [archaeon]